MGEGAHMHVCPAVLCPSGALVRDHLSLPALQEASCTPVRCLGLELQMLLTMKQADGRHKSKN